MREISGLKITAALPDLSRLQAHIPLYLEPTNNINKAKRDRLLEAVTSAIAKLEAQS